MNLDLIIALALFAFASSITPGPNNLMLLASGVNFGFRASVPHMLGISHGFMLMVFLVGIGLGAVFTQLPILHTILKWGGAAYMLYLAWKIAHAGSPKGEHSAGAKPMSYFAAALFQWVNPKAWMMAITTFSTYSPAGFGIGWAVLTAVVFGVINLPCVSVWAAFGQAMRRFLNDPTKVKYFNWSMAGLLVLSIVPMVL